MQALLLVGGLGTRLKSVVSDRPKPMADVNGKPFLEYLLLELKKNNITKLIMAVGYQGDMIENYFGNGQNWGVEIQYSYEKEQLGTAGAIKNAGNLISEEYIFVLNGDTFYKAAYTDVLDLYQNGRYDMVLTLREVSDVSRYGKVELKGNHIVAFNEKEQQQKAGLINGGIYLIHKSILDWIPNRKCSLENEVIPQLLQEGLNIGGVVNRGYFIDIGIPEDYKRFIDDVQNKVI